MENSSKAHTALDEGDVKGAFVRVDSGYRHHISKDPNNKFQPEAGRYHLYVAYACPWAHRTLITRALKGLEDVISVSIVHSTWQRTRPDDENDQHAGWVFRSENDPPLTTSLGFGSFGNEGCIPDTVNNTKTMREIYELAGDTFGKYSVPVLWDKKLKTIVNNESSEIVEMFNSEFNEFSKNKCQDLSPPELKAKQDEVNSWVYDNINNGVYKCGFAKTQEAYEIAFDKLFEHLDKMEDLLSKQRYLTGDKFTIADIRAFVTLLRFDEVYIVYFKCNKKAIKDYPNILNYVREIYQMEGVASTVNMDHIKRHYYTSHHLLNHYGIVPKGPNFLALLHEPHNRK